MIFSFFSKLLLFRATKDRSQEGLMAAVGTTSTFRVKKFAEAAQFYSTASCVNIITYIRQCDSRSKGIKSRQDANALLRELIYKILHS